MTSKYLKTPKKILFLGNISYTFSFKEIDNKRNKGYEIFERYIYGNGLDGLFALA